MYIFWPLCTAFDGYILLSIPYTIFYGYTLLSTGIYYFRQVYTIFNGYILLSTLFTWLWFCKNQILSCKPRICGLKPRLEFNIILLTLLQLHFFCSSIVSYINFNSPIWKCWKCEIFFALRCKWFARETSNPQN